MTPEKLQEKHRQKYDPNMFSGKSYDEMMQDRYDNMFKNPYVHFDGTYEFDKGEYDGVTDGLVGYAISEDAPEGGWGEGPWESYMVYFREFRGGYHAYKSPRRNGYVESSGTFTPWQLELPFDD